MVSLKTTNHLLFSFADYIVWLHVTECHHFHLLIMFKNVSTQRSSSAMNEERELQLGLNRKGDGG